MTNIFNKLIAVGTGEIPHIYRGLCPDKAHPDSRDYACMACIILIDAANEDVELKALREQEPVAAQCRFNGETEWKNCTAAHHLHVEAHPKEWPHYETRALYARPVPALTSKVGSMGIPISCGKPLCAPDNHHPLCNRRTLSYKSTQKGGFVSYSRAAKARASAGRFSNY